MCRKPIGWSQYAPKGCFLSFGRGGGLNSHQIPLVPINNPSKSSLFSSSSHQIPLVPNNNHIKILLFPSSSHELPFIPKPNLT